MTTEEAATLAAEVGALKSIEISVSQNLRGNAFDAHVPPKFGFGLLTIHFGMPVDEAFRYLATTIIRNKFYLHAKQNKIYYDVFGSLGCWVPNKKMVDQLLATHPPSRGPTRSPITHSKSCLVQ